MNASSADAEQGTLEYIPLDTPSPLPPCESINLLHMESVAVPYFLFCFHSNMVLVPSPFFIGAELTKWAVAVCCGPGDSWSCVEDTEQAWGGCK